jgi:hypothetical protein
VAIAGLVYMVLAIELTLVWNSILGVYTIGTVGQLIPFVIGAAGLLKVFYKIFAKKFIASFVDPLVHPASMEQTTDPPRTTFPLFYPSFQHPDGVWVTGDPELFLQQESQEQGSENLTL